MKDKLRKAVEDKDKQKLIKCLNFDNLNKFDSNCFEYFGKALYMVYSIKVKDIANASNLCSLKF